MNELIASLEIQLQLLEELYALLKREAGELSEIRLDAIAEINLLKDDVAGRIEAHSNLLRKEIAVAASCEGLQSETTLGELAALYKQKGFNKVSALHEDLNSTARGIKEAVSLNRTIAERFAVSVSGSLELLMRVINQSNTYGSSGAYQQKLTGAVLVNREA